MRVGTTLYIQGYEDWDRYEALERGEEVEPLDPATDQKRFLEEIDTALKLEDWGFDSLWTVEHHISPYTMVTNPIQLLTYFAGATSTMDMGTMITVLPWHHPLRVAEDMTMLQYVLNGRHAFIGLGRGAGRREFRQLGIEMGDSKELFAESAQIILKALTEEKFTHIGENYQFEDITMRPRPLNPQQLIEDLHFAWGTPTSAEVGARLGLKPLIIPQKPWSEYPAELAAFAKARADVGLAPARPRIHMNVYCAETEAEASEIAHRHIPEYADSAARNYELYGDHFATTKGYEHYADMAMFVKSKDEMVKGMAQTYIDNHVWGTPEQCIAKLRAIADQFHPEEFMLVMRFGSMTKEVSDKSIALFAKEVLPAVHEFETLEPITYEPAAV